MQKELRVNNRIRVPEVQVIDDKGEQLGIMAIQKALELAKENDLDLVEVGPQSNPPITKLMDYGKYMYKKEKQEKKSASKPKGDTLKTVRIGFKTGEHDLKFKAGKIDEFLREGYGVRLEIFLRGREKSMADVGRTKLSTFMGYMSEPYSITSDIKKSPRGWDAVIRKDTKKKG